MNYYEHHIRDYDAATSHLSWDEDLAYTRLIRWYYRKEQPIPADIKEACRLVRATSKSQKAAVESVLREFFILQDDGWHQEVCDLALEKFLAGEPEREVKKANENNRLRNHRDERAKLFKALTDAGEHAPWNIGIAELRSLVARISGAVPETEPETPATAPATPATATQSPSTNTQTPVLKTIGQVVVGGSPTRELSDDFTPKDAAEWLRHFKAKHGFEADPSNVNDRKKIWPVFAGWVNAGLTASFVDAAVALAISRTREPIACLPLYVDRLMAGEQAARASPERNAKDESRRTAAQVLTSVTMSPSHEPSHGSIVDVDAKLLG